MAAVKVRTLSRWMNLFQGDASNLIFLLEENGKKGRENATSLSFSFLEDQGDVC